MKEMIALEILKTYINKNIGMCAVPQYVKNSIAELEELQSRSCDGCKYFNSSINRGLCFRLDIAVSKTFCCQGYEAKEH